MCRRLKWKPMYRKPIRRPKTHWEDDVLEDIKSVNVCNWKKVVRNRESSWGSQTLTQVVALYKNNFLWKVDDFSFLSIKLAAHRPRMESKWGCGSEPSVRNLVWKKCDIVCKQKSVIIIIIIRRRRRRRRRTTTTIISHLVEFQLRNAKVNHKSRKKELQHKL